MAEEKTQNLFQTLFRNELTWLGTIVAAVWFYVVTTVIPINSLNVQMAQIQSQNAATTKAYTTLTAQVQLISTAQQVTDTKVDALENHVYTSK